MPSWPSYSEDEIQAVKKVLESNNVNYWTGDEGRKFESEFAIEQDKFTLIPFLLKESLLFVSNMPRGNLV